MCAGKLWLLMWSSRAPNAFGSNASTRASAETETAPFAETAPFTAVLDPEVEAAEDASPSSLGASVATAAPSALAVLLLLVLDVEEAELCAAGDGNDDELAADDDELAAEEGLGELPLPEDGTGDSRAGLLGGGAEETATEEPLPQASESDIATTKTVGHRNKNRRA